MNIPGTYKQSFIVMVCTLPSSSFIIHLIVPILVTSKFPPVPNDIVLGVGG